MNKKVIAIILIVAGTALAVWGYNIYDAATSQLSRAVTGETPIEAWLGLIVGSVCLLIGLARLK
jgi:uncharacterized membrane protein YidH (DUF202 family)